MKILDLHEAPLPVVKKILVGVEERGGRLYDLQRRVLEHATSFSKCDPDAADQIFKKLVGKGLKEITSAQIINICPRRKDELIMLFNFENKAVSDEELEELLSDIRSLCSC